MYDIYSSFLWILHDFSAHEKRQIDSTSNCLSLGKKASAIKTCKGLGEAPRHNKKGWWSGPCRLFNSAGMPGKSFIYTRAFHVTTH